MKVTKQFSFDAAHVLSLPYISKCARLHGHRWLVEVEIAGPLSKQGMIIDFSEIVEEVTTVLDKLDHHTLVPSAFVVDSFQSNSITFQIPTGDSQNEKRYVLPASDVIILPFDNVTCENLAKYIYKELSKRLKSPLCLNSIKLFESPTSWAEYP